MKNCNSVQLFFSTTLFYIGKNTNKLLLRNKNNNFSQKHKKTQK